MALDDSLEQLIASGDGRTWRYRDAWAALGRQVGTPITASDFENALKKLAKKGLVRVREGGAEPRIIPEGATPPQNDDDPGTADAETEADLPVGVRTEASMMPPVEAWIQNAFLASFGAIAGDSVVLKDTSRKGPIGSGVWSRPDFVAARVRRYKFHTARQVELYGFELKRADRGKIVSVHEALAHTRFVHFSYLMWHLPAGSPFRSGLDDIRAHCALHGIGLIVFTDPEVPGSFTTELDPERKSPEQPQIDEFIQSRFDVEQIDQLLSALKSP